MAPTRNHLHGCLIAACWTLAFAPAQAVTLEAVASEASVVVGDTVAIAIVVSGLGDGAASSLGSYDFTLTYDPLVFAFTGQHSGRELGAADLSTVTEGVLAGASEVSFFAASHHPPSDLVSWQPPTFTVVTTSFTALASGSTPFSLSVNGGLGDEDGAPLAPLQIMDTNVMAVAGPAPVPAITVGLAMVLVLLLAATALVGMRRRAR